MYKLLFLGLVSAEKCSLESIPHSWHLALETAFRIKQSELDVIKHGMARISFALGSDEAGLPFRRQIAFTVNTLGQMANLYFIFKKVIPFSHYFSYYVRPIAIAKCLLYMKEVERLVF